MTAPDCAITGYEVVVDAGPAAPWIMMVHGVSQDRRIFKTQVEFFRNKYRILLVDLPGHGLSHAHVGPYGLNEFASALSAALASAGAERSHFWGTHLGASAGLLLATSRPDLFVSLVLEAPVFPGRAIAPVTQMLNRTSEVARRNGIAEALEYWWRESPWFQIMRTHPIECRAEEHRAIIGDFQGKPWLAAGLATQVAPIDNLLMHCMLPVLLIHGEHDLPEFKRAGDELANLLPCCQRLEVADAGGFPLWEFPYRVNASVDEFLESRSSAQSPTHHGRARDW